MSSQKVSKKLGIVINWNPSQADLRNVFEIIKKEGKYAWGTGGVQLKPKAADLPDGKIIGLLRRSGQDNFIYGFKVDISKEYRVYLNPTTGKNKDVIRKEHEKYRYPWRHKSQKAFLFLSDGFILRNPIQTSQIITWNKKPYRSDIYRAAVFIDLKESNIDSEKVLKEKQNADKFLKNPLINLLDIKEDNLVNAFVFILKSYPDLSNDFLEFCGIPKPNDYQIILRRQSESAKVKMNIPDIQFIGEDDSFKVIVEAKLDSKVNKEQLKNYKDENEGIVVCIVRDEMKIHVKGVKFISWEEIYNIVESFEKTIDKEEKVLIKYFLEYLNFLAISNIHN